MIKRPLDPRFNELVLAGKKTTTIRKAPWPSGVPIMLYNWSGAAYRSKQINVTPVVVKCSWSIRISRNCDDSMRYGCELESTRLLHESEGFASQREMNEWFREMVKVGKTIELHLMEFSKVEVLP